MKALILNGTLKKEGLSNTQVLSEFLASEFEKQGAEAEIIRLVDHRILPGTMNDMGYEDGWPPILKKIQYADVLVFGTPIWWNSHSSELQRAIERLDGLHDEIMAGRPSRLEGKSAGVLVTGDSDGAMHIISHLGNFFNAIGLQFPPFASLTVLWDKQTKGAQTSHGELWQKYESDYRTAAEKMVRNLLAAVKSV